MTSKYSASMSRRWFSRVTSRSRFSLVDLRLRVQRVNERVRVEEQLEDRVQQLADEPQHSAVRVEHRRVFERERRHDRRVVARLVLLELLEQVGADAARVEELLELDRRELADLLLGVVDAALLADARPDLLHDLLDVDRIGADVEIGHKQLSAFSASGRAGK